MGGLAAGLVGGPAAGPPENASYEELLAWEEARGGGVALGMSSIQLSSLPRRAFLGGRDALKGEEAECSICQEAYEEGDELSTLPCCHTFHAGCVSRWLAGKHSCPVCMRDVRQDLRQ